MNLRSQPRVEQGYRIGHPHQYQGAPSDRMHAKIVILRFEGDYVAADTRRQSAQQGGRKGSRNRLCPWFREGRRTAGCLSAIGLGRGDYRRVNDQQLNGRVARWSSLGRW